jgi:hypothetical protein
MRDGRLTDAEKLLTDAIHELEQNDPKNPRLADYLKELAGLIDRRGRHADANALIARAYEIERNTYGPSDLRLTNDLTGQALQAQFAGDLREAERLLNQALEIVHSNGSNLNSNLNVGLAARVFGRLATFYITQRRWADAERMMQEEEKLCNFYEEPYRAGYGDCGSLQARFAEVYRAEGRTVEAEQLPRNEGVPAELVS